MTTLIDLDDADALDAALVGRKSVGVARLRRAGFTVPDGLVVPVGAPGADAARLAGMAAAPWGSVAVRSSGTREDLTTTARAGVGRTELHVSGADAIADAVTRCLAQADGGLGEVAVLVQPMLAPSHAGVAFSADPVTGERDVVRLQAVEGVADALLAGEVTGIDVLVRGGQVEGNLGTLPVDHVRAVAEAVRRVEVAFGAPQDVEWAIVDGDVALLQARPITVLPVKPTYPTGNGWEKDIAHYGDLLTPFGWWALRPVTEVTAEVFPQAGFLINGLEEQLVGGETYGRVIAAIGPADPGRTPPPPAVVFGAAARLVPALRARTKAAQRTLDGAMPDEWIRDWRERHRPHVVALAAQWRSLDLGSLSDDDLVTRLRELMVEAVDGGRAHFRMIVPWTLTLHEVHKLCSQLDGWDTSATMQLFVGASSPTSEADRELASLRESVATTPGAADAIEALGPSGDVVDALLSVDDELAGQVQRWIDRHGWRAVNYDAGVPVLAESAGLVARLLLATSGASAAHDPSTDATGVAADHASATRARLPEADRATFDVALARAREVHPLREDTAIVGGDVLLGLARRWLLEAGRRLVRREVLGSVSDASYLDGNEVVAALDGRLSPSEAQARVVRRRGEEAWVRRSPGPITIGHQSGAPDVSRLPAPLRQVNEAVLWMVSQEYPGAPSVSAGDGGAVLVAGVGASPGVAEGPVTIVRNLDDLDRLRAGDVLVCQVASPALVPIFGMCAAVVTDGGGALSHTAIAAREHGIPAILGTVTATATLQPGQVVRVDATRGTVTAV